MGLAALFFGALITAGIVKLALNPTPIALVIEDFIPTSYHPAHRTEEVTGFSQTAVVRSTSMETAIAETAELPSQDGLIAKETHLGRDDSDEILDSYVSVDSEDTETISNAPEECPVPMTPAQLTSKPISSEFRFNELIADCKSDEEEVTLDPQHFEPTIDGLMAEYLSEELVALRTDYDRKLEELRSDGGKNKRLGRDYYESFAKLSELSHRAEGVPLLVHNVVQELTTDRDVYFLVSSAAGSWLNWSQRGSNGIVLAGRVVALSVADKQVTIRIRNKAKTKLNVNLINSVSANIGDELIVLGRIVEHSSGQTIRGYARKFKELAVQAK